MYPLIVYGAAQLLFPHQANGSLLVDKSNTVRGSELLAQNFTGAGYFHPRPSAAGSNGYDPTSSGGSNLGPTSSNLVANITANIAAYRSDNGLATNAPVPADAVTESASGLDPHISVANAELQIPRVARVRGISEDRVREPGEFVGTTLLSTLLVLFYFLIGGAVIVFLGWWALKKFK